MDRALACRTAPLHYARAEASVATCLEEFVRTPGYRCNTGEDAPVVIDGNRIVDTDVRQARADALEVAARDKSWQDAIAVRMRQPRWNDAAKREINDSRTLGTRNLVEGLRGAGPRLTTLVSQSAVGYYGAHGDERLDEASPPGDDFLARVVIDWEAEAVRAEVELGLRVVTCRTGVVLAREGGALEQMLPPFKLGVGGPVAGGRQYVPWVHLDDVVGAILFSLDNEAASGPLNITAPEPATNKELSKALGRALRRPAIAPVPAFAVKLLYGEMARIVTTGQRAIPRQLEELGFAFRHPELDEALEAALKK